MRKLPFAILINLPVIGAILRMSLDPFNSSMAKDDFYQNWTDEDRQKVLSFCKEHPNEVITYRLLNKILNKHN